MAWHALSLLINQLQAFVRSGMQMCVTAEGLISQFFLCSQLPNTRLIQ